LCIIENLQILFKQNTWQRANEGKSKKAKVKSKTLFFTFAFLLFTFYF